MNLWVCRSEVKSLSTVRLFETPWRPTGSSIHGIFQARILGWVAISPLGDLPNPGIEPGSPTLQVDSLLSEPPGKPVLTTANCGKFFKEMRTSDHLTCLPRKLYMGQEATVRTGHETTDWFQIGKGVHQGCILSPCLFNLYADYIIWNGRLDEAQAGIKISGRNINSLTYADDITLMAESKEELNNLLMRMKEESEKAGLKFSIKKLWSWHLVPSLHGKFWGEKWK